jgi:hypothetical protein
MDLTPFPPDPTLVQNRSWNILRPSTNGGESARRSVHPSAERARIPPKTAFGPAFEILVDGSASGVDFGQHVSRIPEA